MQTEITWIGFLFYNVQREVYHTIPLTRVIAPLAAKLGP